MLLHPLVHLSQAYPRDLFFHDLLRRDGGAITEWTAMGDSYASGVGVEP